jgi:hypothetical protein
VNESTISSTGHEDDLKMAIQGYQLRIAEMGMRIEVLRAMLNGGAPYAPFPEPTAAEQETILKVLKRGVEIRKARGQRKKVSRKVRALAEKGQESLKPKKKFSAATRKKMAESQRKRWAAKKIAGVGAKKAA